MNLDFINDGRSTIHVHAEGCRDADRLWKDRQHNGSRWTAAAATQADAVREVYPPEDFEYDPGDWHEFAGDLKFYPCAQLEAEVADSEADHLAQDVATGIETTCEGLDSALRAFEMLDEVAPRAREAYRDVEQALRQAVTAVVAARDALPATADVDTTAPCRTDGCDGDPDSGEGWDGYCGSCADQLDSTS